MQGAVPPRGGGTVAAVREREGSNGPVHPVGPHWKRHELPACPQQLELSLPIHCPAPTERLMRPGVCAVLITPVPCYSRYVTQRGRRLLVLNPCLSVSTVRFERGRKSDDCC